MRVLNFPAAAAVALTTLRESLRTKVPVAAAVAAAVTVAAATLLARVTIGDPIKVVKDFGLFAVSVSAVLYAAVVGGTLLHKELQRRTVYNVLSKPVRRSDFLVGKFVGTYLSALWVIAVTGGVTWLYCSAYQGNVDGAYPVALFYVALELLIVCAASSFFSALVVTPVLNALFTLGFFVAGRSAPRLVESAARDGDRILGYLGGVLPDLSSLYVADSIVYGEVPSPSHLLSSALYALSYALFLLTAACAVNSARDFS